MRNKSSTAPEELRNLIFYLDGLRYSFAMAEVSSKRLRETLDSVAQLCDASDHSEGEVVSALLDAWTLIDMCYRIRELIQQTPGLSQRSPQVQVFLRATAEVERLRHHVQHFRSGIAKIPTPSNPLWGALSWVPSYDQTSCYTIFSGNIVQGLCAPTCVFDTHQNSFTHSFMLFSGNIGLDLGRVSDSLAMLKSFLLQWIDAHPILKRVTGKTLVWKFAIKARGQDNSGETHTG